MQDIDDEDMTYDLDLSSYVPYGPGKTLPATTLLDRAGTHWDGCYVAGSRHWPCAVAEANRQRTRAEQAERERDAWQRNAAMWHDKADATEDAHNRTVAAYDDAMDRLEAANVRAEATKRERDAWQRSASQWHDAADAAQAARDRITVAYDEAMERLENVPYSAILRASYGAQTAEDTSAIAIWIASIDWNDVDSDASQCHCPSCEAVAEQL